ncbi:hypothetical protein B0T20DRAFT_495361 [Sordaria brevicollis]|uniref:Uncharacterized protein n=1 Tax=Sordaria brevicollis TaxID=83679 RepID=A0AAE0PJM6_SORBR|nr:hypothetical protein B0T20DRAFT_495361 [Sordaria brevicollis]
MRPSTLITSVVAAATAVAAIPVSACPEFNKEGFAIKYPRLYPTAAAWDPATCLLFVGSRVEPKVIVYDPYKDHILREIEIPGLEPKSDYQISSIHWDMYTAWWTFLATRGNWEDLRDPTQAGNTIIARYDFSKDRFLWTIDLEGRMKDWAYKKAKWGGFHGLEVDDRGQVYFAGTFQGSRDHWGNIPPTTSIVFRVPGKHVNIRGLVAVPGSYRLMTHSTDTGYLGMFNMGCEDNDVVPKWLTSDCMSANVKILDIQSMTLPPKYLENNVMLLTSPTQGVQVMQSFGWKWQPDDILNKHPAYQHTFGIIPPTFRMRAEGAFPSDTVQVGPSSVYVMWGHKVGHNFHGRVKDEKTWFFEDITEAVEEALIIKVRDGTDGQPTDWNNPDIYPSADQMDERARLQDGWHLNKEWKWKGCDGYRS